LRTPDSGKDRRYVMVQGGNRMVIESYDVKASAQRTFLKVESTTMRASREIRAVPAGQSEREAEDRVSISAQAKDILKQIREESHRRLAEGNHAAAVARTKRGLKTPSTPEELKLRLIELMLEMMTGKKTRMKMHPQAEIESRSNNNMQGFAGGEAIRTQVVDKLNIEHFYYESERLSYQAQGLVNTADGRTINLDINMFMSRQFVSYMNINIEIQKPVDPLVINYGGTAASLLGESFEFDLDMDGIPDKLALLGEGRGFLALDKNGDGIINDGSELFGPSTGCGFSELRQYDEDGNGWIDEADSIFSKLVVWSRDKDGNDQMFTLKELGIGAIYLGDIDTEFSFKDESNQTLGIMRSTSFFLNENGGGGTVSHIDLML